MRLGHVPQSLAIALMCRMFMLAMAAFVSEPVELFFNATENSSIHRIEAASPA